MNTPYELSVCQHGDGGDDDGDVDDEEVEVAAASELDIYNRVPTVHPRGKVIDLQIHSAPFLLSPIQLQNETVFVVILVSI